MPSTPAQLRRRDRVEALIRLASPFLDLMLATGDRVARIAAPTGEDYYAIRPPGEQTGTDAIGPTRVTVRSGRQHEA